MEVDPFEMESYLREGYRMSQPHNCPDELYVYITTQYVKPSDLIKNRRMRGREFECHAVPEGQHNYIRSKQY